MFFKNVDRIVKNYHKEAAEKKKKTQASLTLP